MDQPYQQSSTLKIGKIIVGIICPPVGHAIDVALAVKYLCNGDMKAFWSATFSLAVDATIFGIFSYAKVLARKEVEIALLQTLNQELKGKSIAFAKRAGNLLRKDLANGAIKNVVNTTAHKMTRKSVRTFVMDLIVNSMVENSVARASGNTSLRYCGSYVKTNWTKLSVIAKRLWKSLKKYNLITLSFNSRETLLKFFKTNGNNLALNLRDGLWKFREAYDWNMIVQQIKLFIGQIVRQQPEKSTTRFFTFCFAQTVAVKTSENILKNTHWLCKGITFIKAFILFVSY